MRFDVGMPMHDDELSISRQLVRRLVDRDLPRFAALPLHRLRASGSSNALFRLGTDYLVRLPRQPGGSTSVETEARWLPHLGPALPVAVPEVVAVGEPGFGYPERWAVTRWIEGFSPATPEPDGPSSDAFALDLAGFVGALRAIEVPAEAADDPRLRSYRSAALADIDVDIRRCLGDCRALPDLPLDLDVCCEVWAQAVASSAPTARSDDRWVHADLLAENLLVRGGRLAAVLDFGGLAMGDPSVDLVVAWDALGPRARELFRSKLDVDDTTWLRGRGWALAIAVMTFPYYWESMPARCAARLAMARQVLADRGGSRIATR